MRKSALIVAAAMSGILFLGGVGLLVTGILTDSWVTALTGGLLIALVAAASLAGAAYVGRRITRVMNQQSTSLRNLRRRQEREAARSDELEAALTEAKEREKSLQEDVQRSREILSPMQQDIDGLSDSIRTFGATIQTDHHIVQSLGERLYEAESSLGSLHQRVEERQSSTAELEASLEGHARQLTILRRRLPAHSLESLQQEMSDARRDVTVLRRRLRKVELRHLESALHLGEPATSLLTREQALLTVSDYLKADQLLKTIPLLRAFPLVEDLPLSKLRRLFRFFRSAGYWEIALEVLEAVQARSGKKSDLESAKKIRSEVEVYRNPSAPVQELPEAPVYDPSGPIIHVVGRLLPTTQSGYTLRTHYTALAQVNAGLRPLVVGQSGSQGYADEPAASYTFDGVEYTVLPGTPRLDLPLDQWVAQDTRLLAEFVAHERPSVLHAHSDFFNAMLATAVGRHFSIPVVYESRGFWEESWLARLITKQDWHSQHEWLFETHGLPFAYEGRRDAEIAVREGVDHVFTLAEVMKDHIVTSSNGRLDPSKVSMVPNAVDPAEFPVQVKDQALATTIGIPADSLVIGYISSIVEYEGIDVLIDGFADAQRRSDRTLCLLLVGDGSMAEQLQAKVREEGVENVIFTGRVPHDKVLAHYGLIDIFVVPRSRSRVTELVTPLKPFEAFATGRALVMSDVGALKEIADQSGAVEMFRADDPQDLSRVLHSLISDEAHRRELSNRGQSWVRDHRTWDRNATEYIRVYQDLGYTGGTAAGLKAEVALRRRGIDPEAVVNALVEAPQSPTKGWFRLEQTTPSAKRLIELGWQYKEFDHIHVTELRTLKDWARYGQENRSWGFHLHEWSFLDPLIEAFDETADLSWLERAAALAVQWLNLHQDTEDTVDEMAWYDMALALRTPRLISLTQRIARNRGFTLDTAVLADGIALHFEELARDRAFNPRTNHGFFTAAAQVHGAKYASGIPGAEQAKSQGAERLAHMAHTQFAPDGTHLEHSPDYHRMMLSSFERALEDGLIDDEEIAGRVRRAAHALGWMIQPHGAILQFGDSPEKKMIRRNARSTDQEALFILSDGAQGSSPREEMAVFPDGGYAFVRSPQPREAGELADSGYLAFSAAFHSRAHKHADDLNVVWSERGHEILVDSGRYGYGKLLPPKSPLRADGFYYEDPERQYVEGTMAHNTLMMDGVNQDRRQRKPYGSGITECTATNGTFDLSGRVPHEDYVHRRRVAYRPGRDLLLMDSVFSRADHAREGIVWFNLAGHFEIEENAEVLTFYVPDADLHLTVEADAELIRPVRGQQEPLRGWRSRKDRTLEPTWSFGFKLPVQQRASLSTRLRWL